MPINKQELSDPELDNAVSECEKQHPENVDGCIRVRTEQFLTRGSAWLDLHKKKKIIEEMIAQASGSLQGNSTTLGRKMSKWGVVPVVIKPYQAHHLISSEITKHVSDLTLLARAFDNGYDINNANNGIFLPGLSIPSALSGLAVHIGQHPDEYIEWVIEKFKRQSKHLTQNSKPEEILGLVQNIEDQIWLLIVNRQLPVQASSVQLNPRRRKDQKLLEMRKTFYADKKRFEILLRTGNVFGIPLRIVEELENKINETETEIKRRGITPPPIIDNEQSPRELLDEHKRELAAIASKSNSKITD